MYSIHSEVIYLFAALWQVMQLCEKLLLNFFDRLTGSISPLYRAIVFCMVCSSSTLRCRCRPIVRRLVGVLGGTVRAQQLLLEFQKYLETANLRVSL